MTGLTESKPTAKSSSRRALLAGALGGIGAVAAGAIGRARPVRAADHDPLTIGEYNNATSLTQLENSTDTTSVLNVRSYFAGMSGTYAIQGQSDSGGIGVSGLTATNAGVAGRSQSGTGVSGASGTTPAVQLRTGVYGYANQSSGSRGVWGNSPKGHGLHGHATSGVGVFGSANGGFAFRGSGRVRFDKVSGVKTIPAGSTGVTVNPGVNITSESFVLLTPRANVGSRALWYVPNTTQNTFRIRMSSKRSADTKVGWLLLR